MFYADAHCDLLYRLMQGRGETDVTPETLRAGGVALQVFAAFAGSQREGDAPRDPRANVSRQLDILDELCGGAWPALRKAGGAPFAPEAGVTYALPAIEGGEALEGSAERLNGYHARGVRIVTLTWNYENEIGHPAVGGGTEGLKPQGRLLVSQMLRLGIRPDTSHLNERGFYDLADMGAPLMASHSCARALHDHPRNLTDAQLRLIAETGGFVGVNFYPAFLTGGGADADDIVRHIEYMMNLAGEARVGFGSDFDGIDTKPRGIDSPTDFTKIADALRRRGHSEACVAGVCGGNLVRFLCEQ